jgi:hypothetical protein
MPTHVQPILSLLLTAVVATSVLTCSDQDGPLVNRLVGTYWISNVDSGARPVIFIPFDGACGAQCGGHSGWVLHTLQEKYIFTPGETTLVTDSIALLESAVIQFAADSTVLLYWRQAMKRYFGTDSIRTSGFEHHIPGYYRAAPDNLVPMFIGDSQAVGSIEGDEVHVRMPPPDNTGLSRSSRLRLQWRRVP